MTSEPHRMSASPARSLFSCFGVELEYMIVRRDGLAVAPWADRILRGRDGRPVSDIDRGRITWSNELTAHVIELKTTDPEPALDGLAEAFAGEVREVNRRLAAEGARLLPTAMHPWMRPDEAVLWKHEYSEVYETFDRIFDCRGHGWSNLQSVHLNLPFSSDDEFARLHAAIRLVLPLLPALAASSPFVEGRRTGWPDNRLAFYRGNSARLPALAGRVVPEPVYSQEHYNREIFGAIARQLRPHDPAGVLEPEFSNSRGAIARFSRQSIEIRLLDVQECPAADLAVVRTVVALLRELVAEARLGRSAQQQAGVEPLAAVLHACIEQGGQARVTDPVLAQAFGAQPGAAAIDFWRAAIERLAPGNRSSAGEQHALEVLVRQGCLAERMVAACPQPDAHSLVELYRQLADCLEANRPFAG